MLGSTHFLVGAALGALAPHPLSAATVGFASHFLADAVPHTDHSILHFEEIERGNLDYRLTPQDWLIITADALILVIIVFILLTAPAQFVPVFFGGLGAILPDLLDNNPFWKRAFRATAAGRLFHAIHLAFHARVIPAKDWVRGLLPQLVASAFALLILFFHSR